MRQTNRKHTPETMRNELTVAHRNGRPAEIDDLALLIQNAERAKGAPPLPGVTAARNRQGMRRFHREKLSAGESYDTPRLTQILVTDWVEDPGGQRWRVTRITGDRAWRDVPGEPLVSCPLGLLKIVDGPGAPAPARVDASPVLAPTEAGETCRGMVQPAPTEAGETLYHAAWDALEAQDWVALETALRAYETALG